MNEKFKRYGKAVSVSVGLAALLCDFIASGFTVSNVSDAIDAMHELSGSLANYFTVFTIFFATAPIVLGVLVSGWLIHYILFTRNGNVGSWAYWVLAGVWLIAISISARVMHPPGLSSAEGLALPRGSFFLGSLFLFEFRWIFTAYGIILALQGLVIGLVAVGAKAYFSWKWERAGDDTDRHSK